MTEDDPSHTRTENDIVMPGTLKNHESIRAVLRDGALSMADLKCSSGHRVETVWQSNRYK